MSNKKLAEIKQEMGSEITHFLYRVPLQEMDNQIKVDSIMYSFFLFPLL
jgi:hypothetical protein